jgi:RNA polymerase subunit RPABC4/transcription elongation factor Spt4
MSLVPCRSCEKPLNKDAKICPNCGAKNPTKIKNLQILDG